MNDHDRPVRSVTSRRRILGGGLLGLLGFAGGAAAAEATEPTPESRNTTLVLRGVDWRLQRAGTAAGELPSPSALANSHGRLQDEDGEDVGRFSSAAVPGAGGAMVLHTFDLGDSVLFGMGGAALADATFAIIGGTGRFGGATGSYDAQQRPREAGGDGTADFHLQIRTEG